MSVTCQTVVIKLVTTGIHWHALSEPVGKCTYAPVQRKCQMHVSTSRVQTSDISVVRWLFGTSTAGLLVVLFE